MDEVHDPDWKVLEEQPEDEVRTVEPESGESYRVMEVEPGEAGYASSGVLASGGVRECIVVAAHDPEDGQGYMRHFLADQIEPKDLGYELLQAKMDVSSFAEPEDLDWRAAGGYGGDPDFDDGESGGVQNSKEAAARRHIVDRFFNNFDYQAEWITNPGRVIEVYLHLDKGMFGYHDLGSQDEDMVKDPDYMWL